MRVWIEMLPVHFGNLSISVTLCVRVWIEIMRRSTSAYTYGVTLCVRVWIEINRPPSPFQAWDSHPLREGVD